MRSKQDIRNLSLSELRDYLGGIGERPYRAGQIFFWIYKRGAERFCDMTDLALDLRRRLAADFSLLPPEGAQTFVARDRTQKFLFDLGQHQHVETVVIPTARRATVCLSTQVGCKFHCRFCASGLKGWARDLSTAEILGQALSVQRRIPARKITHIVFMGIGEPLDNYDRVLKAVRIFNAPEGMNIAARRITLSTCGLVPQISKLAGEGLQIELAVSLHGYDDQSRQALMPVAKRFSFQKLIAACREYTVATKRQVTFEYVLIRGLTCQKKAVKSLGRSLKGMNCKMNLIPYNRVLDLPFAAPTAKEARDFKEELLREGIRATIRAPRGEDISAACGQLRHLAS